MKRLLYIPILFLIACQTDSSSREIELGGNASFTVLCNDLFQPWSVKHGKDDYLWITENTHIVSRIDPSTGINYPLDVLIDIDPKDCFAFFVHGLEFHSNFPDSSFVYLSYVYLNPNDTATGHLDVVRLNYDSLSQSLSNPKYIIQDLYNEERMIVGGRLLVDSTFLYVATSDERIELGSSQDTSLLTGKILRYNMDGSIPSSNPFTGSPIWSLGHRNPQGLTIYDGTLYTSEHGPSDNDEINLIVPGKNYGWPVFSGDIKYDSLSQDLTNHQLPILAWTPTIAPSSLAYLNIEDENYFLLPTLKEADIRLIHSNQEGMTESAILFNESIGRIRDIVVCPNNRIFAISYNRVQGTLSYYHTPKSDTTLKYDVLIEIFLNE